MKAVTITESKDKYLNTIMTVRFECEGWDFNYEGNGAICLRCDGFHAIPETIATNAHIGLFIEWAEEAKAIYESSEDWHKTITYIRSRKASRRG